MLATLDVASTAVRKSVLKRRKKRDNSYTQVNDGCCQVQGHHKKDGRI